MIKRIKRKYALIIMTSVIIVLGLIITGINVTNYTSIGSLLDDKLTMLVENDGLIPEVNFGVPPTSTESDDPDDSDDESADDSDDSSDTDQEDADSDIPIDNDGDTAEDGDDDAPIENGGTEDGEEAEEDEKTDDTEEDEEDEKEESKKEESKKEELYQSMSPETPFELRYFSVKLDTDGNLLDVYTEKIAAVNDVQAVRYALDIYEEGDFDTSGFVDTYRYMVGSTSDGNLIYVFLDANRELKSYTTFLISSLVIPAVGILIVFAVVLLFSNTALRPIIESYEKQKRFITDAGHEMKTPLTIISANAEIIEMESGESQWSSGIKSQVARLTDLTEKLVILSKMEEGAKLIMSEFSLTDAFFDTCAQYKSMAMSKGIAFDLDVPDNLTAIGNENEIRRCISLLLDNAFRYVSESGFVSVTALNANGRIEIKFVNSTTGVDKGSLDIWFDRFYRTDRSRNSATGGSGIGLSVVKAIVLAHGGTVHAHSADGINVEFTITI